MKRNIVIAQLYGSAMNTIYTVKIMCSLNTDVTQSCDLGKTGRKGSMWGGDVGRGE